MEQISLMKPKAETEHEVGMLEYLEDIIGSSRFKEPINQLVERVELQSEIRDEKWNRCKIAKNELEDLRAPMEAALRYVQLENSITALNHKLLQKKIFMCEKESEEKKDIVQNLEKEHEDLKRNLKEKRKGCMYFLVQIYINTLFDYYCFLIITEIKEKESANSEMLKKLEKLTALKESAKAAFEANKLNDVALQQVIENSNKKRKETKKALAAEEEKKVKLEKVPEKNKETIAELDALEPKLEDERQTAENNHAKIMESLAKDTQPLQVLTDPPRIFRLYVECIYTIYGVHFYYNEICFRIKKKTFRQS